MQMRLWLVFRRGLTVMLLICMAGSAYAANAGLDPVATLRAKHAALEERLQKNQFMRPLVLDSDDMTNRLKGDIYAIVDYPFDAVSTGLIDPDHWCDLMLLHINTKYCGVREQSSGTTLNINIGKKTPEELTNAARVEFSYKVAAATPEYFEIMLSASEGPMGTSAYRVLLKAVALPNAKTFLHLSYSYAVNLSGRIAMEAYLGTIGSGKVGFSLTGKRTGGKPDYIGGVRGMMERNTMRYYLAIDAFLDAASATPAARPEKRLQSWFTATERYARQLHEMDRNEYLEMKRAEYVRQQSVQ